MSIESFEAELAAIPQKPMGEFSFRLRPYLRDWVQEASAASEFSMTDIFNNAVGCAAYRRLAKKHELELKLSASRHRNHVIPGASRPVRVRAGDIPGRVVLAAVNNSFLHWMNETERMSNETVVHDGLRIIGAAAAAGVGARLEIGAPGYSSYMQLRIVDVSQARPLLMQA